jgi:predicted methyltransferase
VKCFWLVNNDLLQPEEHHLKLAPRKLLILLPMFALLTACGSSTKLADKPIPVAATVTPPPSTIEDAVSNTNYRTPGNSDRDKYRHPIETLNFFGLKPDMTVVELVPGGGWYLEILAPLLNEKGQYIGTVPPKGVSEYFDKYLAKLDTYMKAHPELESKAKFVTFNPPETVDLAPEGTVDMVLTFRNVHNWSSKKGQGAVFAAVFKALKPGGVFGVVDHRANPKGKAPKAESGYLLEKDVIAWAQKAGFKLDSKSEVNANPKDTKDYADGVWTLPPSLRQGDKDKEKYLAIGESDRMTLRFVKPMPKTKK